MDVYRTARLLALALAPFATAGAPAGAQAPVFVTDGAGTPRATAPRLRRVESPPRLAPPADELAGSKIPPRAPQTDADRTNAARIARAFDLSTLPAAGADSPAHAPAPPLPRGRDLAVMLASATSGAEAPSRGELLRQIDQAARAAHTVGDLSALVALCEGQPDEPRARGALAWALNRRGELLAARGDERLAGRDFNAALRADPSLWQALVNRGVSHARRGAHARAEEDFTRALSIQPDAPLVLHNRGEARLALGRPAEAAADFTAAIEGGIQDHRVLTARAHAKYQLGDNRGATRDLNRSLRESPNSPDALALRGVIFAEQGLYEQARADLYAALAADATSAPAYQSLAWLLATCPEDRFRDARRALEAAERAQRFGAPDDPLVLDTLAAAHAEAGDFDAAVRLAQQAAATAPDAWQAELRGRVALYRAGRPFRQTTR